MVAAFCCVRNQKESLRFLKCLLCGPRVPGPRLLFGPADRLVNGPLATDDPGDIRSFGRGCARCRRGQEGARAIGAATHFLGGSGSAGHHDLLDMATMTTCQISG